MKIVVKLLPLLLLACDEILSTEAVVLPNFYPFGQSAGDQFIPENDDESSGTVPISIQFPFFDQNHNSLFVNTNGVISFLVQVSQFTPDAFPLGDNRRLVAPFWADVDTRNGGDVFFRETTDPNLLQQATNDVTATFVDQRKFKATWLLIATWYEVAFYGASGINTNKRNTFQAVLISNGRHSFVIFNYNKITWTTGTASSGNETGLGGTPAQAGFNAGDGRRFFSIPGSRTHQVINLPTQSNVGRPGRWIFRIDNAKIEAGGCNTKGSLVVSPRTAIMLGGDNIFIAGPCYQPSAVIVCEFAGGKISNGSYISNIQASCTVPMLYITGRLAIKMSVNGGTSFDFQGVVTIVNINRFTPRVVRLLANTWLEQSPLRVTWDPARLGSENQKVSVQLARFSMRTKGVVFDSMFTLVAEQANTGQCQFIVPKGKGQGAAVGDGRFITLVLVKKTGHSSGNSPAEWIWSDLFSWISYEFGQQRCMHWYRNQPHPKIYIDDPSLLPCPQTLVQAMADRGRFTVDEYCNPDAEEHCERYHYKATHCFRSNTPSNQGAGQQCCYNEQGNLMVGPLNVNGGSLDRFHIEAGVPVFSHFSHDLVPYLDCCLFSNNCEKYFEKRPSDDSSNYEPPRPATGFGDPHMITLDGKEYTFNGYGEYQILNVAGPDFQLQGRMQPLMNDDGSNTRATIYKAFAMRENGSDVVQFHISGRNEIEVLVNGNLVEFDEELMMDFNGIIILKYNNTSKYSAIFDSGISVTIEKVERILQMMLLVPPMFKGNTSGLLGFWDGDQEKEFLLPNGTFLETNSSQNRIHYEFGQLWSTTATDSLFTYDEGKNHSSYFDVGYVPIFLDRDNLVFDNVTLGQQARDVCGDNKQCLFDVHTTGKVSIGVASKQAVESLIAVVNETETPGCRPIKNILQNGSMQRNDSEDGGMVYKFHCNKGFRLNGSTVIHCYQGQWNGSKPSCEPKGCIPIENTLQNGSMQRNDSEDGGMVYKFHCDEGFRLNGPAVIQCHQGQWNGSKPSCEPKGCIPIENILQNGSMQRNDSEDGGMVYKFHCDKGFSLNGPAVIQCHQGQWNGSKPSCEPKGCIPITNILQNGSMKRNDSEDGGMVYKFHCDKGFRLNGPAVIQCHQGQWNGSKPSCEPKVCLPVGSFENGQGHGNGITVGSRYWFTCSKGFTLIGSNMILCGKDGQWNGTLPKCSKDIIPSSTRTPWYIFAAVSAAAVFVVVAAIAVLICFLQRRRKDRQHSSKEQAASQVGKEIKQDLVFLASFTNPAYTSTSDIKSEGLRLEIWPIKEM